MKSNDQIVNDFDLIRDVFAIQPPKEFTTLRDQIAFAMTNKSDLNIENLDKEVIQGLNDDPGLMELLGFNGESPIPEEYLLQPKYRDTSLGGNDAINCYPQFHEDDDLVHPLHAIDNYGNRGLGRAYEEKIDKNQQILWITFGVPRFTNLSKFYMTAIDTRLAQLMNTGDSWNAFTIGRTVGKVVGFIATLPLQPFIYMASLISRLFSPHYGSTKYYSLKPTMPLYYRIVNTQMAILAANMQLTKPDKYLDENPSSWDSIFDLEHYSRQNQEISDQLDEMLNQTDSTNDIFDLKSNKTPSDFQSNKLMDINSDGKINSPINNVSNAEANGLPYLFTKYGLDILHILSKKDLFDSKKDISSMKDLDDYLKELKNYSQGSNNFWKEVASGFLSGTYESFSFVGFKIEKSTDSSESLSNTTAQPNIADTVNSKIQSIKSMKVDMANFNLMGTGGVVGSVIDSVRGFLSGALDQVGLSGIASLLTGQGLVDFQEIWQDSSFTKSYNFNMKIRAVSGDRVSLFYKYVILLMILAGSLPRAVGRNSYTSPFILRAYSKGMFAVPLGIIDSITIKRGGSDFGWSIERLPLSIDVTFTIKDLSPVMFIGMADNKSFIDIVGQNSSFDEYMMTLSGLTLQDRLLFSKKIKRGMEILCKISRNNKINPMMWGLRASNNTFIGKAAIALSPISKLPTK